MHPHSPGVYPINYPGPIKRSCPLAVKYPKEPKISEVQSMCRGRGLERVPARGDMVKWAPDGRHPDELFAADGILSLDKG